MKSIGYIPFLLMALLACSTKKYLPRIFNPDMAKINVNHTTLYYERGGKGLPLEMSHKCMIPGYDPRDYGQSALLPESDGSRPATITSMEPMSNLEPDILADALGQDILNQKLKTN